MESTYTYGAVINFADAAAVGTPGSTQVPISSDSDFFCTRLEIFVRIDDTGRGDVFAGDDGATEIGGFPDAALLLQITDSGADRTWHSQPVDAGMYRPGNRGFSKPRLVRFGTQLVLDVSVLKIAAAGTGWDVRFTFQGWKDYDRPSARLAM